ncbi:hypothetical protein KCV06_g380, partial [Aureobasidium melanogenum]
MSFQNRQMVESQVYKNHVCLDTGERADYGNDFSSSPPLHFFYYDLHLLHTKRKRERKKDFNEGVKATSVMSPDLVDERKVSTIDKTKTKSTKIWYMKVGVILRTKSARSICIMRESRQFISVTLRLGRSLHRLFSSPSSLSLSPSSDESSSVSPSSSVSSSSSSVPTSSSSDSSVSSSDDSSSSSSSQSSNVFSLAGAPDFDFSRYRVRNPCDFHLDLAPAVQAWVRAGGEMQAQYSKALLATRGTCGRDREGLFRQTDDCLGVCERIALDHVSDDFQSLGYKMLVWTVDLTKYFERNDQLLVLTRGLEQGRGLVRSVRVQ